MTHSQLYDLLEFPQDLKDQLYRYTDERSCEISDELKARLFCRATWDDGVKELQSILGEDPYGTKILWEQLEFVRRYSYEEYVKRGISMEVFVDTFKFITRFVVPSRNSDGLYTYKHAWWFQRQVTLEEFRIGALEFEMVEANNEKVVEIHIPSDADMRLPALCDSVKEFKKFASRFWPEWENIQMATETWMLMPELEQFLPPESKILAFKKLFDIDYVDYDQTWYMDWIFPGYTEISDDLPENTTLHRKLKAYLLSGKKFGIAKGHLVMDRIR